MANELQVTASLVYSKPVATLGTVSLAVTESGNVSRQIDITSGRKASAAQSIGTAEEQFSVVDVSSVRYFLIQNLDATNFVQVGTATGAYSIKLLPGDVALFPPNASALFLKADTAACLVSIQAVGA